MLDILCDCLSETWLIILFVLLMYCLAKWEEYKKKHGSKKYELRNFKDFGTAFERTHYR